jgi:hypothetical protein
MATATDLENRHWRITEKTYQNNKASDYTEKIEELERNFNYANNCDHYWGIPELSVLYGTPLYDQASEQQKLALNHLYWIGAYNMVAGSEASTIVFNQVTSNVFFSLGGYDTLCRELDLETNQERYHMHAFRNIDQQVQKALLGDKQEDPHLRTTLGFLRGGLGGRLGAKPTMKFLNFCWGSTPFLASQYYCMRYIANVVLKNKEHAYALYCKDLERQGNFVPAPTAISRYHLLDESFHTTMSLLLGQEFFKELPKPSAYEVFLINLTVYLAQKRILGGFSGAIPGSFIRDGVAFMPLVFSTLQSRLFNFSKGETLRWMDKIFCEEHEGFYITQKYHQRLVKDLCRFFGAIDHMWPVNKEMRLVKAGGSIAKTLSRNRREFQSFCSSVA